MTAVTDEFPYYLRPKKAVFSGLICVAMYLMGLILTTDVSDLQGAHKLGELGGAVLAAVAAPGPTRPFPVAGTLVCGSVLTLE